MALAEDPGKGKKRRGGEETYRGWLKIRGRYWVAANRRASVCLTLARLYLHLLRSEDKMKSCPLLPSSSWYVF